MNDDTRRIRNLFAWGAIGALIGGIYGMAWAVLIYLLLDSVPTK